MSGVLGQEHRRLLLQSARGAIVARLRDQGFAAPEAPDILREKRGAFVSLHSRATRGLRGCIGYVEPVLPLNEAVVRLALAAAFEDPRFTPLGASEVDDVEIEISVLSVPAPVELDEIEVGRHGLIVERGSRRGLLLPQVPGEFGWDRDEFLDHTCQKAGLAPGAWRESGTVVLAFTAEVFGET